MNEQEKVFGKDCKWCMEFYKKHALEKTIDSSHRCFHPEAMQTDYHPVYGKTISSKIHCHNKNAKFDCSDFESKKE